MNWFGSFTVGLHSLSYKDFTQSFTVSERAHAMFLGNQEGAVSVVGASFLPNACFRLPIALSPAHWAPRPLLLSGQCPLK